MFLTEASVDDVVSAWSSFGFVQHDYVVSCFKPEELYVGFREDSGPNSVIFVAKDDAWTADELRDHSISGLPDGLGDNIAGCEWEMKPGVSRDEVWRQLMDTGFHPLPNELRDQLF